MLCKGAKVILQSVQTATFKRTDLFGFIIIQMIVLNDWINRLYCYKKQINKV